MATNDVPGASQANNDQLHVGCWAECDDGSLLYVLGMENGSVVYQMYDVSKPAVVFYQDAMREQAFKQQFSFPPVGSSQIKWTWHDKTSFPWDRVMQAMSRPEPTFAEVEQTLSAAARVAEVLQLRAQKLSEEDLQRAMPQERKTSRSIIERLRGALEELLKD